MLGVFPYLLIGYMIDCIKEPGKGGLPLGGEIEDIILALILVTVPELDCI